MAVSRIAPFCLRFLVVRINDEFSPLKSRRNVARSINGAWDSSSHADKTTTPRNEAKTSHDKTYGSEDPFVRYLGVCGGVGAPRPRRRHAHDRWVRVRGPQGRLWLQPSPRSGSQGAGVASWREARRGGERP